MTASANPIERAIDQGGGLKPLAANLGVAWQAVQKWRRVNRIPAERVLALETLTGVPRYELRPDLYPPSEYSTRG